MWSITSWRKRTRKSAGLALLLVAGVPCSPCWGLADTVAVEGLTQPVPRTIRVGTAADLQLYGTALLRVAMTLRVYVGLLYLPAEPEAMAADDVARRLEIHYLVNVPLRRMVDAANESLRRTCTTEELRALRARIERLHAAYADRVKGDVAALTYVPGQGTTFSVNGADLVTIPGRDFAAAYFGVWLGPHAASRSVRDSLLAGRARKGGATP